MQNAREAATLKARTVAILCATVFATATPAIADHGEIHPPGLPCGYTVEVIERPECPNPFFTPRIWVQGMNADGTVVGYRDHCDIDSGGGRRVAWVWQPGDTVPTDLPLPPDIYSSRAYDVNDNGVIVGEFKEFSEPWRGFVYDPNTGEWTELEPVDPTGSGTAIAFAINNAGVVAGTRSIGESQNPYNAFIWSADDGYTDLGVMYGQNSWAYDVNDSGTAAGGSGQTTDYLDFLFDAPDLHKLGPVEGGHTSNVWGMNESGDVTGVGHKLDESGSPIWQKAFAWSDGEFTLLDPLPEYQRALGRDIDKDGIVVGFSVTWPGPLEFRATVWADGIGFDLTDLVLTTDDISLEDADKINSQGQILTSGDVDGIGSNLGVLLTPIDTPLGDLTGDCEVGADDLGLLLSEWNKRDSPADLTGDGTVGGADLGVLLSNWTK